MPAKTGAQLVVRRAGPKGRHALEIRREYRGAPSGEPIALGYREALQLAQVISFVRLHGMPIDCAWLGWDGRPALRVGWRRRGFPSPAPALRLEALGPRGGQLWAVDLPDPGPMAKALAEVLRELAEPRDARGSEPEIPVLAGRSLQDRGVGRGARSRPGPGDKRRSSLNPEGTYARPVRRRRAREYEPGLGITWDRYEYRGQSFELLSGPPPFDLQTGRIFEDHEVYNESGAWIGADRPVPHRRLTNGALAALSGAEIQSLFERYREGDYGEGECGFAVYESLRGERLYLVDEATRSLEGEPPLRDPRTSPGPQTLLLASEY